MWEIDKRTVRYTKDYLISGAVAWSSDGKMLAMPIGERDTRLIHVTVFDPATGASQRRLVPAGGWNALAFSPDATLLAAGGGGWNKEFFIWETRTGALRKRVQAIEAPALHAELTSLAFSPDGRLIATAGIDRMKRLTAIKLWDVESGSLVRTIAHSSEVQAVAFSPDGLQLASAAADRTVHVWNVATGRSAHTLRGHDGPVRDVAYSPDGRIIASVGYDFRARLWEAATGRELLQLIVLPPTGDGLSTEWIAITPKGYFNASPGAGRFIRWRAGDRLFPAERYETTFRRPDLIAKVLR